MTAGFCYITADGHVATVADKAVAQAMAEDTGTSWWEADAPRRRPEGLPAGSMRGR